MFVFIQHANARGASLRGKLFAGVSAAALGAATFVSVVLGASAARADQQTQQQWARQEQAVQLAKAAIERCNFEQYEYARGIYDTNSDFLENFLQHFSGGEPHFPEFPHPCQPKKIEIANNRAFVEFAGVTAGINESFYDFYSVEVMAGGGVVGAYQNFTSAYSLGAPDFFNPTLLQTYGSEGFFGGSLHIPVFDVFPAPQSSNQHLGVGFEATFLGGAGQVDRQATPLPSAVTQSDLYKFRANWIVTADATISAPVPSAPSWSWTLRAGAAGVNEKVTYYSGGYSALAGVAPFTQSDTFFTWGYDVGGGVAYTPPGGWMTLHADLYQIVPAYKNGLTFGNPATVFTTSNVKEDITVVTGGVSIPLSAERLHKLFLP
jgi:hypothetical protein